VSDPGRESEASDRFLGQDPVDRASAALAAKQHAVIDLEQLRVLGLGARAVQLRAGKGRLHRIYHRVYSLVPHQLLTQKGRWMAAVLACGPGAVLSHRCAAALHGLLQTNQLKIDVTVPGRSCRAHAGLDIHRSTTLTPTDVTTVDGIPSTTVARTTLDIAGVLPRRRLERALDQSEILEVFDYASLSDQIERNSKRPGAALLRTVLHEHRIGETATWSELEEAFFAICRSAGVPQPQVNQQLVLPDDEPAIRPDFLWRQPLLIVETDGHKTHRTRYAFESDRRKDQRLTVAGIPHFRTTRRQVFSNPREVEKTVVAMWRRYADGAKPTPET
jgi:predicted transcriptional regulator of viral defense system/very-short-patch-repair endonuclease